jgi:large subunit ribosomal protein L23
MEKILKSAVVSEKSYRMVNEGKYCFLAPKYITKEDAVRIIENTFGTPVEKINVLVRAGKVKRTKQGKANRNPMKKFVVKLVTGKKLDIFDMEEREGKKDGRKKGEK